MKHIVVWVLVIALSGCATLRKMPQRTEDAFTDPIRRSHVLTQIGLSGSAMSVSITCAMLLSPTIAGMLVCPIVGMFYYFATYEFVLEPISKDRVAKGKPSLVGPYWERGPQDGEIFERP